MKKKTMKIFSLFAIMLLMSGCVKYNINMKVTNDKKMKMELIMAFSKTLMEQAGESSTDEEALKKLKDEGWKIEDYSDDDYTGNKLTKTFKNIDDISTTSKTEYDINALVEEGEESKYMFYKKTENGKTTYVANFKVNINDALGDNGFEDEDEDDDEYDFDYDEEDEDDDEYDFDYDEDEDEEDDSQYEEMAQQMLSSMDLKFSIEVPKVISSNATKTDGNKLTWDLTKMKDGTGIEFEFEVTGSTLPIIPIAIGGGVLLLAVIAVIVLKSKKGNNDKTPSVDQTGIGNTTPIPEMNTSMNMTAAPTMSNPVESVPTTPAPVEPVPTITNPTEVAPPVMMTPQESTSTPEMISPQENTTEPMISTPQETPVIETPSETVPMQNPTEPTNNNNLM